MSSVGPIVFIIIVVIVHSFVVVIEGHPVRSLTISQTYDSSRRVRRENLCRVRCCCCCCSVDIVAVVVEATTIAQTHVILAIDIALGGYVFVAGVDIVCVVGTGVLLLLLLLLLMRFRLVLVPESQIWYKLRIIWDREFERNYPNHWAASLLNAL